VDGEIRALVARWGALWGVPDLEQGVSVSFSTRLRRSLGRCRPSTGRVTLRADLRHGDPERLAEVLCHEVAHVAVFRLHGRAAAPHGAEWRELVSRAGFAPRVNAMEIAPARRPLSEPTPILPYEHRATNPVETTVERSALMKRVRQEGTDVELTIRRALFRIGARYRLNVKDLPGRPDIANKRLKKAIFAHGCFWHYHTACSGGRVPKRNKAFWEEKLADNVERDRRKEHALQQRGYEVLVLWACEINDRGTLERRLKEYWFGNA
jgi:DNA mismatch endonuclease (patch repair protein)